MMRGKDALNIYQQTQIKTLSQGKLIIMLYDGAIKNLTLALKEMEEKNYEQTNNYLIKAQEIINELAVTLNLDAGELAHNLLRLYRSMNALLVQANIKNDQDIVKRVVKMLSELRQAWATINYDASSPERGGVASA